MLWDRTRPFPSGQMRSDMKPPGARKLKDLLKKRARWVDMQRLLMTGEVQQFNANAKHQTV